MKLKLYLTFSMLVLTSVVFAQAKKTITGSVKDTEGIPLLGATIVLEGTEFGTSADDNGIFTIQAGEGDVLVISYVFFETQKVRITSKTHYDIKLKEDGQVLDDVIVVAYGTATKESVTGAIAVVDSNDITKRPATNALGALEGAAPGIRVNNTSGQPGTEPEIRIRGFSSLAGNAANRPLLVVDGIAFGGNISDINPNDIESMSVLKDASASTLYGNRASNGVIMITTKKASKGKGFFGVSIKQGLFTRGIKEYETLGANDFMETMWTGYRNNLINKDTNIEQASALASQKLVSDILWTNIYNLPGDKLFDENGKLVSNATMLPGYAGDLDWYKPIERTGMYQDINMNGRVANEKGGAYFSGGFLNNEGYFKGSDFKRFTGRVNGDYKVNEVIKVGANISASHQMSNGLNATTDDTGSYNNPFMYARSIAPIYPVHLHDAKTGDFVYNENGEKMYDPGDSTRKQYSGRHVIWENELNSIESIRNTVNGQFFADFKFLEDFTFTLKGDLSLRNSESRKYDNAIVGDGKGNSGRSRRDIYRYKTYSAQQLLNWNKSFGSHNVEVLVGHENFNNDYSYLYGLKAGETFPGIPEWANFSDVTSLTDYTIKYRTEGYLSRAKYNYNNKYFVEGSFRRDGSSKFHKDSRWGNFWSVGGSWIVTAEDFFKVKQIDYLKLRASYGEVGNDGGAGTYAYQALYAIVKNGGTPGLYKNQNGNDDLQWETSSSVNVGIDGRLFNRANFTVEYFDKRSQNLLFDLNMPLSNGSTSAGTIKSSVLSNVGTISNSGLELSFDVDVIRNKDWKWNVGFNATWLKNKVVRLPDENREHGIPSSPFLRKEGKSIYEFWIPKFVGVDQMTGKSLYLVDAENYDVNGSAPGKDKIDAANLVTINGVTYTTNTSFGKREFAGNALPKMEGSFTTSLSYKNFSLSALFTYALGGKMIDYSYMSLMSVNTTPSAIHKDVLNSWNGVPEGMTETSPDRIDPNGTPLVQFGTVGTQNNALSDRFVKNGNYLVIKNVGLNYEMPKAMLTKMGVSQLSFNLGVENLATFTKLRGMNPQQSFNGTSQDAWVTARTFIFGVNVGF